MTCPAPLRRAHATRAPGGPLPDTTQHHRTKTASCPSPDPPAIPWRRAAGRSRLRCLASGYWQAVAYSIENFAAEYRERPSRRRSRIACRCHRPGLHHRHPAALRQGVPLTRTGVLGPHRGSQAVRGREAQPPLGAARVRRRHAPNHPGPAGRDFLSILTLSYFARCPRSTRPDTPSGTTTAGTWSAPAPQGGHLHPRTTDRAGPQPQLGCRHRPAAQGLGRPDEITPDVPIASIQRAIEREEADLSLDSHVTQAQVVALRADPERSRRRSVNMTGPLLFWCSGPTGGPARSPTSGSGRRSTTPSTRLPTATPSPDGSRPPASWPPRSWRRGRSATTTTTCTRPPGAGATQPRPEPCWPTPVTPTGWP